MPKEIADYLNKIGARIPNIKPGKATIEYLTKIQASTRFWGMSPTICSYRSYSIIFLPLTAFFIFLYAPSSNVFYGKFSGGLLLSFLATTSSILDHHLRHINEGFARGFTSVLIIVSELVPQLAFLVFVGFSAWHCFSKALV